MVYSGARHLGRVSIGVTTTLHERMVPSLLVADYREEMQRRVEEADRRSADRLEVRVKLSRQDHQDIIEAYNQLASMNPWYKSVSRRLRDLSIRVRDALDTAPDG